MGRGSLPHGLVLHRQVFPGGGQGFRPPAGLVKAFELIKRLYAGLSRIDARVAPTRLAMVLLVAAEKQRAAAD